jgi:hypothetical protein
MGNGQWAMGNKMGNGQWAMGNKMGNGQWAMGNKMGNGQWAIKWAMGISLHLPLFVDFFLLFLFAFRVNMTVNVI